MHLNGTNCATNPLERCQPCDRHLGTSQSGALTNGDVMNKKGPQKQAGGGGGGGVGASVPAHAASDTCAFASATITATSLAMLPADATHSVSSQSASASTKPSAHAIADACMHAALVRGSTFRRLGSCQPRTQTWPRVLSGKGAMPGVTNSSGSADCRGPAPVLHGEENTSPATRRNTDSNHHRKHRTTATDSVVTALRN